MKRLFWFFASLFISSLAIAAGPIYLHKDQQNQREFQELYDETKKLNSGNNNNSSTFPNVLDYGAKCNGTTDDTAAIQTAINANVGKTLYFPSGTCLISSAIAVPSQMDIHGTFYPGESGGTVIHQSSSAASIFQFRYSDPNTITSIHGFKLSGGFNQIFCPDGAINNFLEKVEFDTPGNAGIYWRGPIQEWFLRDIIFDGGKYGIYFTEQGIHSDGSVGDIFLFDKCNFYSIYAHGQTENGIRIITNNGTGNLDTFLDLRLVTITKDGMVLGGGLDDIEIIGVNTESNGYIGVAPVIPTTATTSVNYSTVTVQTVTGLVAGDTVTIAGAGVNGIDWYPIISTIHSNTLTMTSSAPVTVVGAELTKYQFSDFSFIGNEGSVPSGITLINAFLGITNGVGATRYAVNDTGGFSVTMINSLTGRPIYDPNSQVTTTGDNLSFAIRRPNNFTTEPFRTSSFGGRQAPRTQVVSPPGTGLVMGLSDSNSDGTGTFGDFQVRSSNPGKSLNMDVNGTNGLVTAYAGISDRAYLDMNANVIRNVAPGSVSSSSIYASNDSTTGPYWVGSGKLDITAGGNQAFQFSNTLGNQSFFSVGIPTSSAANLGLFFNGNSSAGLYGNGFGTTGLVGVEINNSSRLEVEKDSVTFHANPVFPTVVAGNCLETNAQGKLIDSGSPCSTGVSGTPTLAVTTGTVSGSSIVISSPTAMIVFDNQTTRGAFLGGATYFFSLDNSSVTTQGVLVAGTNITLTPGSGKTTISAASGSSGLSTINQLTNGATNFIYNKDSLQSGSTFYVSSGTVNGQFAVISTSDTLPTVTITGSNDQITGPLTQWNNVLGWNSVMSSFGKLGIGTTNPQNFLHIYNANQTPGIILEIGNPGVDIFDLYDIRGGGLSLAKSSYRDYSAGSSPVNYGGFFWTNADDSLEEMKLDTNYRLHVGTAAAQTGLAELNVVGNAVIGVDYQDASAANLNNGLTVEGKVEIGTKAQPNAMVTVVIDTANDTGLSIQAASSQSSNLQSWKNSSGVVLSTVDSSGNIFASTITVNAFQITDGTFTINGRTYVFPFDNGGNGQFLQTDGSRRVNWAGAIDLQDTLQTGATFYVSSGTIQNKLILYAFPVINLLTGAREGLEFTDNINSQAMWFGHATTATQDDFYLSNNRNIRTGVFSSTMQATAQMMIESKLNDANINFYTNSANNSSAVLALKIDKNQDALFSGEVTAPYEVLTNTATAVSPLVINAVASQSADLTDWKDSSANTLVSVGATGLVTASSVTVTDKLTVSKAFYLSTGPVKNANYTMTAFDDVIFASGTRLSTIVITLPDAVNTGQQVTIFKVDKSSYPIQIVTQASELIGQTTAQVTLNAPGQKLVAIADGSGWNATSLPISLPYIGVPNDPNSAQAFSASSDTYCQAVYVPDFQVASGMRLAIGTSIDHLDAGLYDSGGNRLGSSGSVSSPGTGVQTLAFTAPTFVQPGTVWTCLASNNNAATFTRNGTDNIEGGCRFTTTFPLPSNLTFPGCTQPTGGRVYAIAAPVYGGPQQ